MQISKLSNQPNFNGICVGASKMNNKQRHIADHIIRHAERELKWPNVCAKGIDAFFLPLKENAIKVLYLDRKSGEFIKNGNKFVETNIDADYKEQEHAFEIINTISKLAEDKSKFPKVDLDNIFNGETTLFKLKQSCYDYLKENYHSLMKNGVKEADAKEQAIAKHFEDIPAGGFNFNF